MTSRIDIYYNSLDKNSKIIVSPLGISYSKIDFIDENSRFFERKISELNYIKLYNLLKNIIKEQELYASYSKLESKLLGITINDINEDNLNNLIRFLTKRLSKNFLSSKDLVKISKYTILHIE